MVPQVRAGQPDWVWTEAGHFTDADVPQLGDFIADADALVAARQSMWRDAPSPSRGVAEAWGWADARAAALLDFWDARLPGAGYLFVYLPPWRAVASLSRLASAEFVGRPDLAYQTWHSYNRAILAFGSAHADRTLLISADALSDDPGRLIAAVNDRFGLALDAQTWPRTPDGRVTGDVEPRLSVLSAATYPECAELLGELEAAADLPSGEPMPAVLVAPPAPENPRVSVIIPCFNDGAFLPETMASVETTIAAPHELLIVDDGSTAALTLGILTRLREAGYRVISQPNRGLAEARNRGVRECHGNVFVPLDADNRLLPGFVDSALAVLDHSAAVMVVYGDRREFGLRAGRVEVGVPDLNRLLCGNYIDACAVIRREAWSACGGYDADMPLQGAEDWELWLAMVSRGFALHRLEFETFEYRVRPGSMLTLTLPAQAQAQIESYILAKHAALYLAHLRRQVDLIEGAEKRIQDLESQLDCLAPTSEDRPSAQD